VNLDIQAYLCAFVNKKQDDWPWHLKMAQYGLNDAQHSALGMSLNMALMGYIIPFPNDLAYSNTEVGSSNAKRRVESMIQVRDVARKCHEKSLQDMNRFADRKWRDAPMLSVGDKVFLLLEHLATKRQSKKIDYGTGRSKLVE